EAGPRDWSGPRQLQSARSGVPPHIAGAPARSGASNRRCPRRFWRRGLAMRALASAGHLAREPRRSGAAHSPESAKCVAASGAPRCIVPLEASLRHVTRDLVVGVTPFALL